MSTPKQLSEHQLECVDECPAHWCHKSATRLRYLESRYAEAQAEIAAKDAEIARLANRVAIANDADASLRLWQKAESELSALKGRTCETCKYHKPRNHDPLADYCESLGAYVPKPFGCSAHEPKDQTEEK